MPRKKKNKEESKELQVVTSINKADGFQSISKNFRNRKSGSSGSGGTGLQKSDSLSLNSFIDKGSQIFDVHTAQSINKKTGKKFGKYLLFSETANEMHEVIDRDCKFNKEYDSKEKCERDTLNEDYPEFCMFGKTCIKTAVSKLIDSKRAEDAKVETISDDDIEAYYGVSLDENNSYNLDEDEIF